MASVPRGGGGGGGGDVLGDCGKIRVTSWIIEHGDTRTARFLLYGVFLRPSLNAVPLD